MNSPVPIAPTVASPAPAPVVPRPPSAHRPPRAPLPPRPAPWTSRLAVVGAPFRHVGLGRLGDLVLPSDDAASRIALRHELQAEELVYVATCNRVECYLLLPRPIDEARLAERFAAFFRPRGVEVEPGALLARRGEATVEHLFTVASSLDSLVVGETDIAGQVRRAAESDVVTGVCGPRLRTLFDRAAQCARRVQASTSFGRAARSIASLALEKARAHFGPEGPRKTVLVGTGETIRKIGRGLAQLPGERLVVGRTLDKAQALASELGARATTIQDMLLEPLTWIDLLVTATAAPETVVPAWALGPTLAARARALCRRPLVICDLGVPHDVDPTIDRVPGVEVISLELIEAMQRSSGAISDEDLASARRVVREEARRLLREERFRRLATDGARALIGDAMRHLSARDRDLLVRFAVGLAGRLARQPQDP